MGAVLYKNFIEKIFSPELGGKSKWNEIMIAGKPVEAFMEEIRKFHGWVAPGVLLGGFMVDYALELVGKEVEADAIVETRFCLPDAVQLLTPCTCGNGWMKVLDWDKFALSLYDKKTREGFRVRLDVDKTAAFPNLYNWFMKLVEKKDLPLEVLNQTILEAGREALSAVSGVYHQLLCQGKERENRRSAPPAGRPTPCARGHSVSPAKGKHITNQSKTPLITF